MIVKDQIDLLQRLELERKLYTSTIHRHVAKSSDGDQRLSDHDDANLLVACEP
jgi:hypothetical protein